MPNFLTFITGTAHAKANDHASRRSRVMRMLGHCWVGFSQQNPLPHPVCSFTISSDCCTGTISGSAFWSSTSRKVPLNVFFLQVSQNLQEHISCTWKADWYASTINAMHKTSVVIYTHTVIHVLIYLYRSMAVCVYICCVCIYIYIHSGYLT